MSAKDFAETLVDALFLAWLNNYETGDRHDSKNEVVVAFRKAETAVLEAIRGRSMTASLSRHEIGTILNRFHSDSTFGTGAAIDAILALFPVAVPSPHLEDFPSVRDGFIQAALTGLLANPNVVGYSSQIGWAPVNCEWKNIGETAVMNADHIMKARKASSTPEGAV